MLVSLNTLHDMVLYTVREQDYMSVHQSVLVSINTHHDTVVYKVRQIALFHLLHGLSALSINIILTCQNTLQILKKTQYMHS